jgi:hypothetical protein
MHDVATDTDILDPTVEILPDLPVLVHEGGARVGRGRRPAAPPARGQVNLPYVVAPR